MRVGKVLEVERVPERDRLYKLIVDIGKDKPIQIVSSLVPFYKEEELRGKNIIILANLKPAKFGGVLSQGMLLCAEKGPKECVLLTTEKDIAPGTPVT